MARHLLGTAAAVVLRHPARPIPLEEEFDMKAIVMSLLIAGMIVPGVAFSAERKHQDEECSVATLFGDYLFTGRADAPAYAHTPGLPSVFAGVFTFNGEGEMSGVSSQSRGGVILARRNVSATYILDSDCMGTITFSGGERFDIFIARDGSEGNFVRVDEGNIATRAIKRR
jgi:hypothetical protein